MTVGEMEPEAAGNLVAARAGKPGPPCGGRGGRTLFTEAGAGPGMAEAK